MQSNETDDRLSPIPMVNGLDCPACGHPTLILGNGGYITCSLEGCPNPDYAEALAMSEHRKTLEARIDELKSFARDFVVQHGVVPARSVSVKKLSDRILELQSQLPKDKGEDT